MADITGDESNHGSIAIVVFNWFYNVYWLFIDLSYDVGGYRDDNLVTFKEG